MIFAEAVPQVFGILHPSGSFVTNLDGWSIPYLLPTGNGQNLSRFLLVLQLFAGSYLVFLMDEVVSKWGIGSGISLFIAAGVAQQIFTGTFNWEPTTQGIPSGAIPKTIFDPVPPAHGERAEPLTVPPRPPAVRWQLSRVPDGRGRLEVGDRVRHLAVHRRGRGTADLHGHVQLGADHPGHPLGRDSEDDLLSAEPELGADRERRLGADDAVSAERPRRPDRDDGDLFHRVVRRVDPDRAAPRPRHGPGGPRPVPDSPAVRVQHPRDPHRGGPRERLDVQPAVLAAPRVARDRPPMVDWGVSERERSAGD